MQKTALVLGLLILALALVFTGCQQSAVKQIPDESNESGSEEKLSGSITIAGSTSVQPLAEELAQAFMEKYPDVKIDVQGGGSSVGVQSAYEGVADIGTASRELKDKEKPYGLHEHVIAKDGIAIVVNPANKAVNDITMEQIKKIYTGEITNWKQLGGNDAKITVVNREEGSGTRGAFTEIVMGKDAKFRDDCIIQPSNGSVRQTVATDPNALGFISMGMLNDSVKGLKVNGVDPTPENVVNGSYKIARPFLMLTKDEPQGVVKAFLDFVCSEKGQEIVGKEYIRVK
ncbi:MAG: phosphate transport system substrate-binding protein [Thermosediminibacterales bacterium]|nr:phosphate transport system substrate-binding protein [Thermosediminibacterales bacterium]MDK2835289.1 phosphate transport system substrate-binding protein [Thermosediminibacterales bacterium]